MQNKETVQQFFDAYTKHDVKTMLSFCTETATFRYVPLGEQGKGSIHKKAARLWQSYMDAFPDFRIDVVSTMETTDGSVVCETLNNGTQKSDVVAIKSKGGRLEVPHLFIFGFDECGLIAKVTAFWDNNTIYTQLGHTEAHD